MKKKICIVSAVVLIMLIAAACGANENDEPASSGSTGQIQNESTDNGNQLAGEGANTATEEQEDANGTREIQYLGESYTVPTTVEHIVITGSLESMEDALVLEVKPTGAMTVGGEFPPLFESITSDATGIGEKTQPSLDTILTLKPDVILASTKFPAETLEKLEKISTTIPVSHISTDWEANLKLLAELTGKEELTEQVLQEYGNTVQAVREKVEPLFRDKTVLAVRIRAGNIYIYPGNVFFNPSIYEDLGAEVPDEVKQAKAQEMVTLEKLSEMNPDYLFVQFSEDENQDAPQALEDLQNNPIWQSIQAVKEGHLFINLVDPLAQGGTFYSKTTFLEAIQSSSLMNE
ncbi:ABC transporter substrate-binding protein [Marinicrinis lubricantis]|uniref:ABC transporter substrate-binding protein n=1 Tax=Marinicrinis lubricantis TaxID=2086470 RepID=A0ABW1IPJ4_9BACL